MKELDRLWNNLPADQKRGAITSGYRLRDLADAIGTEQKESNNALASRLFAWADFETVKRLVGDVENIQRMTVAEIWNTAHESMLDKKDVGLWRTVIPAAETHRAYRLNDFTQAKVIARTIYAPDWRKACSEWLERRIKAKECKKHLAEQRVFCGPETLRKEVQERERFVQENQE